MDGFHPSYLERAATPNLDRLAAGGVRARALLPVFPTETFPNHYSMVTGLYPERHGIVGNRFYDPELEAMFEFDRPEITSDPRWWEAEPIWNTVRRQGLHSATFFWPGSDVEIAGGRPTYWKPYEKGTPHAERVDQVLAWLDLPAGDRPVLITLYFSSVDGVGHEYGPASPRTLAAVRRLDGSIGRLLDGLDDRGISDGVNLIVVSDHGMSSSSPERVVLIDDYIDLDAVRVVDWDPVLSLWPKPGREAEVYHKLRSAHPRLTVYRKHEIPERLHHRDHRRIPPIIAIADDGWRIASRRYFSKYRDRFTGGTHGYDDSLPSMHGIFIAHGPAFRKGLVVKPFRNIQVHALIAEILAIEPAPNDADLEAVSGLLDSGR